MKKSNYSQLITYLCFVGLFFAFYCIIGIFSMIKAPMSKDLHIQTSLLGIMDGAMFFGATLGAISIVAFPVRHPVKTILIYSCIAFVSLQAQVIANNFGAYKNTILIVSRVSVGLCFNIPILMQSVINFYFHQERHQRLVRIWYAFANIGDMCGVLFSDILMNKWQLNWKLTMTISAVIFFIFSAAFFFVVKEINIAENQQANVIDNLRNLRQYFKRPLSILHSISFVSMTCLCYIIFLWLPYYFNIIRMEGEAASITVLFELALFIGTFLLQPALQYFRSHTGLFFIILMLLSNICSCVLLFLGNNPSDITIYKVFVFMTSFFYSSYNSYTSTTDLRDRVNGQQQYLRVNTFNRFMVRLVQLFTSLISGFIMDNDQKIFIKVFMLISIMNTLLIAIRISKYPSSFNRMQKQSKTPLLSRDSQKFDK